MDNKYLSSQNDSSELFANNKIITFNLLFIFIIILLLCFIIFGYDNKNIEVQQYLNKIYVNNIKLKENYGILINPNFNLININNNMHLVENILNKRYFQYLQNQFSKKNFLVLIFILEKEMV